MELLKATTPTTPEVLVVHAHAALTPRQRLRITKLIAELHRAVAWFAARGVTARRVLTDNGGCYRSRDWATAYTELNLTPKRTRSYRPQTNGKVERFHRTMTAEKAFVQSFTSEADRGAAVLNGCTPTTTTGPTPASAATHPSAA